MAVPGSRSLELELPAVPESVARARRAVAAMLDGLEVDVWPVAMVVSEALTNAVVHAYRDREPGRVRLAASVEGMVLTLVVADDGIGLSPRVDSPGLGVGLAVIRRLAQELEISNDCGTRLRVRLMLAPGP